MTRGIPFIKENRLCDLNLLAIHCHSFMYFTDGRRPGKNFKAFREKAQTWELYKDNEMKYEQIPENENHFIYLFRKLKWVLEEKRIQYLYIHLADKDRYEDAGYDMFQIAKDILDAGKYFVDYLRISSFASAPVNDYLVEKIDCNCMQIDRIEKGTTTIAKKMMACSFLSVMGKLENPGILMDFKGTGLVIQSAEVNGYSNLVQEYLEKWFNGEKPITEYLAVKAAKFDPEYMSVFDKYGYKLEATKYQKLLKFSREDGQKCRIRITEGVGQMELYFEPFNEEVEYQPTQRFYSD